MAKLIVRHPDQGDLDFTLSGERITIGRHSDNLIQINHATISGYHAEIVSQNGQRLIRDLDSTNHSYIEGVMFIQADLDRGCRIVLGTVECEYLPDNVEALPEEIDSLRTTVALLRRQNDELVARIAEQRNQIEMLGNVKLITRDTSSDLADLRDQVRSLAAERDRLASRNADLIAQVEALHAKIGIPSIPRAVPSVETSEAAASVPPRLPKPPIALGETATIPAVHANSKVR
jgi:cell division protein FtsB